MHHPIPHGRFLRACLFAFATFGSLFPSEPSPRGPVARTMPEALARMKPYTGETLKDFSPNEIDGHVFVGYQGWFGTPDDGSGRGWVHYGFGTTKVGGRSRDTATVDLWPDISELDADEQYDSPYKYKDGSVAKVFSSYNPKTVYRHFQWMRQYGIYGAFLQRFAVGVRHPPVLDFYTGVMDAVRRGAAQNGVAWSVMYDLSGLSVGQADTVIEDWKHLVDLAKVREDKAYLRQGGKPVVAVWGVGFADRRGYTIEECRKIIRFLRDDPVYGGNVVIVGVPTYWRTGTRDALPSGQALDVILEADIIQPWSVGRVQSTDDIPEFLENTLREDLKFLKARKKRYMPVAFPGFTWGNLKTVRAWETGKEASPENVTSREDGRFLWTFLSQQAKLGAHCSYIAMFDEIDEGTAIFKCAKTPPEGGDMRFVGYGEIPTDTYLWLAGQGERLFSGKIKPSVRMPERKFGK